MAVETLASILTRHFGTPKAVRELDRKNRRRSVKRRQLRLDFDSEGTADDTDSDEDQRRRSA